MTVKTFALIVSLIAGVAVSAQADESSDSTLLLSEQR